MRIQEKDGHNYNAHDARVLRHGFIMDSGDRRLLKANSRVTAYVGNANDWDTARLRMDSTQL